MTSLSESIRECDSFVGSIFLTRSLLIHPSLMSPRTDDLARDLRTQSENIRGSSVGALVRIVDSRNSNSLTLTAPNRSLQPTVRRQPTAYSCWARPTLYGVFSSKRRPSPPSSSSSSSSIGPPCANLYCRRCPRSSLSWSSFASPSATATRRFRRDSAGNHKYHPRAPPFISTRNLHLPSLIFPFRGERRDTHGHRNVVI